MKEKEVWKINGFLGIVVVLLLSLLGLLELIKGLENETIGGTVAGFVLLGLGSALSTGICMNMPNETRVVTFFGNYIGTLTKPGFWMTVPFSTRSRVSIRVRNFNSDKLKVNDIEGNPIEIAAVVVFKVTDPSKALFDVDRYESFVEIQSETSLRNIASKYPYDIADDKEGVSLRGNAEEIAEELKKDLQERLLIAGVDVIEARLMHLTYSKEIAQAMLQRQQATAVIAARKKIVEGATSMVEDAIGALEKNGTVKFSNQEKAKMANNLMVSIVSERASTPVIDVS